MRQAASNNSLLSDNFSTASRLQNCRKAPRYGSMMIRIILFSLVVFTSSIVNASQEGVLPFSEFSVKSDGIGQSGVVEVKGVKSSEGKFISLTVDAFGKSYSFPEKILSKVSELHQNGIQISYVAGYEQLGGKTVYIQFQKGFTSSIQSKVVVSVNEKGKFRVLGD